MYCLISTRTDTVHNLAYATFCALFAVSFLASLFWGDMTWSILALGLSCIMTYVLYRMIASIVSGKEYRLMIDDDRISWGRICPTTDVVMKPLAEVLGVTRHWRGSSDHGNSTLVFHFTGGDIPVVGTDGVIPFDAIMTDELFCILKYEWKNVRFQTQHAKSTGPWGEEMPPRSYVTTGRYVRVEKSAFPWRRAKSRHTHEPNESTI